MTIKQISPRDAQRLIDTGAALIDIREPDEHDRERIPGALNIPLAKFAPDASLGATLILHCRSGMRTGMAREQLAAAAAGRDCYILDGGIDGWRGAGLVTVKPKGAPIEMQRQVMIVAGMLVLAGTLLTMFVASVFIAIPLFVGAGLMVAGMSGWCGMARLLALAPWNHRQAQPRG